MPQRRRPLPPTARSRRRPPGPAPPPLASRQPRAVSHLLAQIGLVPDRVVAPDIDETPRPRRSPAHPRRAAWRGTSRRGRVAPGSFVLAADTVVAVGRRILPKAGTECAGGALPRAALRAAAPRPDGRGRCARRTAPRRAGERQRGRSSTAVTRRADRRLPRGRGVGGQGRRLRHPGRGRGLRADPAPAATPASSACRSIETAQLLRGPRPPFAVSSPGSGAAPEA